MSTHIVPRKNYYLIFGILLVLTLTTALVAFVDMGPFNIVVAMTIAVVKATLVILFFMHVKQSTPMTKVYVCAGFFWLAIMIFLTMNDYLTRHWLPIDRAW
jgi:cytochrome c oxidase subunit 4